MQENPNAKYLIAGTVALVVVAGMIIYWQMAKPSETVLKPGSVPAKGIGKYDNDNIRK
jgi:hypothetical protein